MIFLVQRWDMSVSWRVLHIRNLGTECDCRLPKDSFCKHFEPMFESWNPGFWRRDRCADSRSTKNIVLNFADTYSCRNFNNTSSGFLQPFFLPQLKFFFQPQEVTLILKVFETCLPGQMCKILVQVLKCKFGVPISKLISLRATSFSQRLEMFVQQGIGTAAFICGIPIKVTTVEFQFPFHMPEFLMFLSKSSQIFIQTWSVTLIIIITYKTFRPLDGKLLPGQVIHKCQLVFITQNHRNATSIEALVQVVGPRTCTSRDQTKMRITFSFRVITHKASNINLGLVFFLPTQRKWSKPGGGGVKGWLAWICHDSHILQWSPNRKIIYKKIVVNQHENPETMETKLTHCGLSQKQYLPPTSHQVDIWIAQTSHLTAFL